MDEAEGSTAARLRADIAAAASTSNSHNPLEEDENAEEEDEFRASALDPTLTGRRDSSIKAYMRELRKVVDNADVLLEVLDARDPLGCRSLETERMLLRAGKKIVLILNKIDLVPKSNIEAWLRYLRHDFPTLAFKASTQSQRNNLSQGLNAVNYSKSSSSDKDAITGGSEAIGAGALLQLIKNYSRSLNMKTSIAVGVFGAPNVGKSSLINSLKRSRVCSVASTPGHTKVVQSVMLDKSVRLLDCPGIVFSDESSSGAAALGLSPEEIQIRRQSALLRNVVKVELVSDPIIPVEAIMARVQPEHLLEVYGLEWFQEGDAQDFLMRVAVQRGRMAKGGLIDIEGTARSVLHDWNVGRIKFFTHPPSLHRSAILSESKGEEGKGVEESAAIVSGFSEAFDLEGLLGAADAEVFGAGTGESNGVLPEAPKPRFAEEEKKVKKIEDDHQPPPPAPVEEEEGDTSRRSTLGKRSRLSSHSSHSDSEDELDTSPSRTRLSVPGLDADHSSDVEDDSLSPAPAESSFTFTSPTGASAWGEKLAFKASKPATPALLDLSQMAPTTGAQRRKMKKLKKRAERAGAGLAGQLMGQKLGEGIVAGEIEGDGERGLGGMFGSIATQKKSNGGGIGRGGKTGSMFDVLLQGQDMLSDDDEEEKVEKDKAVVSASAGGEDYEEEL